MSSSGLLLLLIGILLLFLARRRLAAGGLPSGQVVAIDHTRLVEPAPVMTDPGLGLNGRPDYLLRRGRGLVPVEVKSGGTPSAPYDSHVLQLGAYLALTEAQTGRRPPYGVLAYEHAAFRIPFTPGLERELRRTIRRMRTRFGQAPRRSHDSPERCAGCGYREICDQSLDG